mmetsp:Transcript_37477/g.77736  ORF Transcript_37477/g.77736 Transcript_37477/m.77736 type:complete len:313 (+) Transcript_37477:1654-2592(+)
MNKIVCISLCTVVAIGLLLTVILVPMSFSSLEYYEYGLKERKSGSANLDRVYSRGRYNIGPANRFIKYQADAHTESFEEFAVFSAGSSNSSVGLEFDIDVYFTYFLIQDELPELHKELALGYQDVIASRAKDAIRNRATSVTFTEYFQDREQVERTFRQAVVTRWNEKPSLHCQLDQFHLGRIRIPDSVADKQLENQVQNERNDKEEYLQLAELEREETKVQVNRIHLNQVKQLRTANAESSLIRAQAAAEAERLQSQAQLDGTQLVFQAAGIDTQDRMAAFTYIRTLKERDTVNMDLTNIDPNSVLHTKSA